MNYRQEKRVAHLAAHAKKARTRKKNARRLQRHYDKVLDLRVLGQGIDLGYVAEVMRRTLYQAGISLKCFGEAVANAFSPPTDGTPSCETDTN